MLFANVENLLWSSIAYNERPLTRPTCLASAMTCLSGSLEPSMTMLLRLYCSECDVAKNTRQRHKSALYYVLTVHNRTNKYDDKVTVTARQTADSIQRCNAINLYVTYQHKDGTWQHFVDSSRHRFRMPWHIEM